MAAKITIVAALACSIAAPTLAYSKTYTLCEAEPASLCPSGMINVPCYSPEDWAANACKVRNSNELPKYTIVRTSQEGGGKCGVGIFEVECK